MKKPASFVVYDIGQHGKKSQAPRELKAFLKEILYRFIPRERSATIGVRNARKTLSSDVAFKPLRQEGDKLICYIRPPGVQEGRDIEIYVEGMSPLEMGSAFSRWWKRDSYISLNDLGHLDEKTPEYLSDVQMRELMERLYLNRQPENVRKLPGIELPAHWQGVSLERFTATLITYLEEVGYEVSVPWMGRVVKAISTTSWFQLMENMYVLQNARRKKNRSKGKGKKFLEATFVLPGSRGEFALFQALELIDKEALYDPESFAEACSDHRKLVKEAYKAATQAKDCREKLETLRKEEALLQAKLEALQHSIAEVERELVLSEGISVSDAEQVALALLRERFVRQLTA